MTKETYHFGFLPNKTPLALNIFRSNTIDIHRSLLGCYCSNIFCVLNTEVLRFFVDPQAFAVYFQGTSMSFSFSSHLAQLSKEYGQSLGLQASFFCGGLREKNKKEPPNSQFFSDFQRQEQLQTPNFIHVFSKFF